MRRIRNRRTKRIARALGRRGARLAAAALAAGGLGLGAGAAQAAPVGWTVGQGAGFYDFDDLNAGVALDIDGDGNTDFTLSLGYGGYGGDAIFLTPATVNAINNEVYTDGSFDAFVVSYADPADVFASTDPTTAAPFDTTLWDPDFHTPFESGGFVGLLFEIPGGSPYVGYLDLTVNVGGGLLDSLDINETAFRAVPAPGAGLLLLSSLGLGGLLRRLRGRR